MLNLTITINSITIMFNFSNKILSISVSFNINNGHDGDIYDRGHMTPEVITPRAVSTQHITMLCNGFLSTIHIKTIKDDVVRENEFNMYSDIQQQYIFWSILYFIMLFLNINNIFKDLFFISKGAQEKLRNIYKKYYCLIVNNYYKSIMGPLIPETTEVLYVRQKTINNFSETLEFDLSYLPPRIDNFDNGEINLFQVPENESLEYRDEFNNLKAQLGSIEFIRHDT